MDEQELSRLLVKALAGNGKIIVGSGTGIRPDGTVNVVTASGKSVNAIATGACGTGPMVAILTSNGKWYAKSENEAVEVRSQVVYRRHYKQAVNKKGIHDFWLLMDSHLILVTVQGNEATLKILTKSTEYPPLYNIFHKDQLGLLRLSNTEFYLPRYTSIDIYNITLKTAYTLLGVPNFSYSVPLALVSTYSCCSLPSRHFYFETRESTGSSSEIIHINPDGTREKHSHSAITPFVNDGYSIAAATENIIYMVLHFGQLVRFDLASGSQEDIINNFHSLGELPPDLFPPSRYGFEPFGDLLGEITYVFSDPSETCVYCVCTVVDPGTTPSLMALTQETYYIPGLTFTGIAPEVGSYDTPLYIITGGFPSGLVCPGDSIGGAFQVYRVINDNTVYASDPYSAIGRIGTIEYSYLSVRERRLRTVIFKVEANGNTSLYYKFPGVDNRISADGYRRFYNLPCRGAVIDQKTKDIYMIGSRFDVIESGFFLGQKNKFNDNTLIKITGSNKQLIPLNSRWHPQVPLAERSYLEAEWDPFSQLEPIYKFI